MIFAKIFLLAYQYFFYSH